jgi:hypothetical protein
MLSVWREKTKKYPLNIVKILRGCFLVELGCVGFLRFCRIFKGQNPVKSQKSYAS